MWYHLSVFYSEAELGPAYAKVASCTAVAQVVGAPIAAVILAMDGTGGLRGWQWLFLLEGAVTVAFGAVLRFALAPSPAKARMLSRAEREWLAQRQEAARAAAAGRAGGGRGDGSLLAQCRSIMGEAELVPVLGQQDCRSCVSAGVRHLLS
jgi:MFS family permease